MQRSLHGASAITSHFYTHFTATLDFSLCQDITPYLCLCYQVALRSSVKWHPSFWRWHFVSSSHVINKIFRGLLIHTAPGQWEAHFLPLLPYPNVVAGRAGSRALLELAQGSPARGVQPGAGPALLCVGTPSTQPRELGKGGRARAECHSGLLSRC